MLINRFLHFTTRFNHKLIQRSTNYRWVTSNFSNSTTAAKEKEPLEIIDAPVKFTTSPASRWKASTSRTGRVHVRLWYEPYVILVSLSVFLIYFGILREENDVDEELKRSLYSRIEGLEEHQLKLSLQYNRENNLDTSKIIERLAEIEQEKLARQKM